MTLIETARRIRWQRLSWQTLSAAALAMAVSVMLDRDASLVLASCLVIAAAAVDLLVQTRAVSAHQQVGAAREVTYVIESLCEASQRGMTADEWMELYAERALVTYGAEINEREK